MSDPYERFQNEDLILRDELAVDRTLLANERTLMAYLRSGVALILAGATFIHFSTQPWFGFLGMACIPAGVAVMIFGWSRYRKVRISIDKIRNKLASKPDITGG
ncbi:MAG TPA: DUF202 domain-containing protein [Lentisphaeria bacterium]|nr:MAG: hypothetical protein A2X48_19800 [Lentisphaerae bacterium GWF2_49_21]HBC86942.1 DUF202 domain-containing protein [Lentisphaeria bacterium]